MNVSNYDAFLTQVAHNGFNVTRIEVLKNLLRAHFKKEIVLAYTSDKRNTIGIEVVENHARFLNKSVEDIALRMADERYFVGKDLKAMVTDNAKEAFNNNKTHYQNMFKRSTNQATIIDVADAEVTARREIETVTDYREALNNIPQVEVKTILSDIYNTRVFYLINQDNGQTVFYSMWESFLRVVAGLQLARAVENSGFQADEIQFKMEYHPIGKFENYDKIMEDMAPLYLIKGISQDNLQEFLAYAIKVNYSKFKNNVAPMFKVEPLHPTVSSSAVGNFGTRMTLKSDGKSGGPGESSQKFDIMTRGFLAVSRLYHILVSAGVSPFKVHPRFFSSQFDDPSDKFTSLADVVDYSADYVEAVETFGYKDAVSTYDALGDRKTTAPVLGQESTKIVLANRVSMRIDQLSGYINCLTVASDENYALSHLDEINCVFNIFNFAEYRQAGLNPLLSIYKLGSAEDDISSYVDSLDLDENYDAEILSYMVAPLFEMSPEEVLPYCSLRMDEDLYREMCAKAKGSLKTFLDDLDMYDTDVQIDMLCAIHRFVSNFSYEIEKYKTLFEGSIISTMEYSRYLADLPLLKGLHDVIDGDAPNNSDEENAKRFRESLVVLFKPYYPEITVEHVKGFFGFAPETYAYDSLISQIQSSTFKNLITHFKSAKANLYTLGEVGSSMLLKTYAEVHKCINHLGPLPLEEREEFDRFTRGAKADKAGFLINDAGYPFSVEVRNFVEGALHSSGYYIFGRDAVRFKQVREESKK